MAEPWLGQPPRPARYRLLQSTFTELSWARLGTGSLLPRPRGLYEYSVHQLRRVLKQNYTS